jgi:hypothetical protein
MEKLVGKAKIEKLFITRGCNSSNGGVANRRSCNTPVLKYHDISKTHENIVDVQLLFRELKPDQAGAILSLGGQSVDDVLDLLPIYVD